MAKKGALRKITGLWIHTKKDGSNETYFSGKMRSGFRVLVYKNKYKRPDRQDPDYYLWIEKEASFPGEEVDRTIKPPPDREEGFKHEAPFPTEEDAPMEPEDSDYGEEEPPF